MTIIRNVKNTSIRLANISYRDALNTRGIKSLSLIQLQSIKLHLLEPTCTKLFPLDAESYDKVFNLAHVFHTHHHASLKKKVMYSLGYISSMDKVVVRIFMFAVSDFQGFHK